MKIELELHEVPKETRFGKVMRSLNQHKVFIEVVENEGTDREEKKMIHCGYIGTFDFLPLSGFPNELCKEVAKQASEKLNRPVGTVEAPLSIDQINALAAKQASEEDE